MWFISVVYFSRRLSVPADYLQPANATVSELKLQHGDRIYAEHASSEVAQDSSPSQTQPMIGHSIKGAVVYEERPATATNER